MAGYFDLFASLAGGAYLAGKHSNNKRKDTEFEYRQCERHEITKSLAPPQKLMEELSNEIVEDGTGKSHSENLEKVSGDISHIFGSNWRERFECTQYADSLINKYHGDMFYDPWAAAFAILLAQKGYVEVHTMGYNTTPTPGERRYPAELCTYDELRRYICDTCRAIEKYIQQSRPEIQAELKIRYMNDYTSTVRMDWELHYDL